MNTNNLFISSLDPYLAYFFMSVTMGFFYTNLHYPIWIGRYGQECLSDSEYQIGVTLMSAEIFLPIWLFGDIFNIFLGTFVVLLNLSGLYMYHSVLIFLTMRRRNRENYQN